jgi:hypothetical protein
MSNGVKIEINVDKTLAEKLTNEVISIVLEKVSKQMKKYINSTLELKHNLPVDIIAAKIEAYSNVLATYSDEEAELIYEGEGKNKKILSVVYKEIPKEENKNDSNIINGGTF